MNNYILTVRLKPFEDESLSSFLYRLSIANGIPFLQLWNFFKSNYTAHYAQWNDINLLDFAPVNTIDLSRLAQSLNINVNQLNNCSFINVLKLLGGEKEVERTRFLSGVLRDVLYYCPNCLKEKTYNRLLWKIKDINSCLVHGCELLCECSQCHKEIKYKDIIVLGECPYCNHNLVASIDKKIEEQEIVKGKWFTDSWNYLIKNVREQVAPSEIGMRMLFILNDQKKGNIDMELVKKTLKEPGVLPTLLQHARDSLSHKRTLHITFIFSVLYDQQISIQRLMELEVPSTFHDSVKNKEGKKSDIVSCFAPWCSSLNNPGSLIKTGTSLKRNVDGRVLKYYMFCKECGCEYAFDELDKLIERGYFIEVYKKLILHDLHNTGFLEMGKLLDISEDKLRRSISYLRTRVVLDCDMKSEKYRIEKNLLNKFVMAIEIGEKIKSIHQWECWRGYEHFLTYRYHLNVMLAISAQELTSPKKNNIKYERNRVYKIVDNFLKEDKDITIKSIANERGVSPETIRLWDGLPYIVKVKEIQNKKRLLKKKEVVYNLIEDYFKNKRQGELSANSLYKYICFGRTYLWRVAPEITAYIGERLRIEKIKRKNGGLYDKESDS